MVGPDGEANFHMWIDGSEDTSNVNERVIVSAYELSALGSGTWSVVVESKDLATDDQDFSLVVTGAISPVEVDAAEAASAGTVSDVVDSGAAPAVAAGSGPLLLTAISSLAILATAMITA